MMFYKIVFNDMIIDAIRNPVWVIWLGRSGRFLNTDPGTANGVIGRDGSTVYNIIGKGSFVNYADQFKTVAVVEITENEYNNLMSQITGENTEVMFIIINIIISALNAFCCRKDKKKNTIVNHNGAFHSYHSGLSKISKVVKKW